MEFRNKLFSKIYKELQDNPEAVDVILSNHPKSKIAFAGLLMLSAMNQEHGDNVDDWECDLDDIVWPEVYKENRESNRMLNSLKNHVNVKVRRNKRVG